MINMIVSDDTKTKPVVKPSPPQTQPQSPEDPIRRDAPSVDPSPKAKK